MIPAYCLTRKDIIIQLQRYGVDASKIPLYMNDENLLAVLDLLESLAVKHGMGPVMAISTGVNNIMERGA